MIAGTSTVIAMALGTLCAYGIVRFKTGGENLAVWILMQRLLPPIAIVFPCSSPTPGSASPTPTSA